VELFSQFLSQSVHWMEKLLTFVYCFCIMRSSFLVEFLGSFRYRILSSANRDNLNSFYFFLLSHCSG
jgi:hypothetical protein